MFNLANDRVDLKFSNSVLEKKVVVRCIVTPFYIYA